MHIIRSVKTVRIAQSLLGIKSYLSFFLGEGQLGLFSWGKVSLVFFLGGGKDSLVSMIANMHMCACGEEYSSREMMVFHISKEFQNKLYTITICKPL